MTLGGENSTSTSNLVGFSLGVAQSAPLEMSPRDEWEMNRLHMESAQTISQNRVKASHLLCPGNHRAAAARTTSMLLSIRTGAPRTCPSSEIHSISTPQLVGIKPNNLIGVTPT